MCYFHLLVALVKIECLALIEIFLNFIKLRELDEKWKTKHRSKALTIVIKIRWHKVKRWREIWLKGIVFPISQVPRVHSLLIAFIIESNRIFWLKWKIQALWAKNILKLSIQIIFLFPSLIQKAIRFTKKNLISYSIWGWMAVSVVYPQATPYLLTLFFRMILKKSLFINDNNVLINDCQE